MAHLECIVLAQSVLIDRDTSNMSIINLIDELVVPKDIPEPEKGTFSPGAFSMMALGIWRRSDRTAPESVDARLRFFGPQRKDSIGATDVKIDLTGSLMRQRTTVKFELFPYVGPGLYKIEFQVKKGSKWASVGASEFMVRKAE